MRISDWSSDVCSSDLRIGTSDPVEPVADVQPLLDRFDFAHFGRAPARFDPAELQQLNARIVHLMDYEDVRERLPSGVTVEAWEAIRPHLSTVAEAADWRSAEHTSELQSLMRISYAVLLL